MVTVYKSTNVFPWRKSEDVRTYGLLGLHCGSAIVVPCETLDQIVLLRTVLNFSTLSIFLVFGLSGFHLERVASRRFFQNSFSKTAFCVLLLFVITFRQIKPYGNLHLM